ncbi:MAG TPA: NACHT domain-containing protein [Pseudonocardiaceae bacterium]|nr:NACHT domain-containing protein [Pseudonocardiaceae bacterium]
MAASSGPAWPIRLAWITVAGAPPVLVLGLSPGLVSTHPTVAVTLVLGYETALAVLSFAGRVVHELEERWTHRAVDIVDRTLRRRLSSFGTTYRNYVMRSLRYIDLRGLATVGFYTPELDDVFVDVSLTHRAPNQVATGLLARVPADVTERRSIHEFLNRRDASVLAVVGAPGSGKTTLLRHIARNAGTSHRLRVRRVPILLYLRDHVAAIVRDPAVTLSALARSTLGQLATPEPEDWFATQLRRGHCAVLLDGLDEVAVPDDRRLVADWVEHLTRQYPKNDYVITSRPLGYREATVDGATVLQVRAFSEDQVAAFVRGWYLAVEQHSTDDNDAEGARLRAEPLANDLLERLRAAVGLYDLTVNPLLLTMIANVHRYRGALPGSRIDLYAEICQVMLWRRQESKRLRMELSGDKKEILLRGLAFGMMRRRVRDLPYADVVAELTPAVRRIARGVNAEDFIADVSSDGLLVERESGRYSFTHLTFQEYLAADHIRDKGMVDMLVTAVDDVWWRETTLLYAARSDADPIVRACLASGSMTATLLAFECAEEAGEVAPELREQLDQLLASAFAPDVAIDRRRQIAGALVAQHLRRLVPVGDGARVSVEPVTTALYWLFLQDHPEHLPDGCAEVRPSVQRAVRGVRGSDALAFTAWVNDVLRGEAAFRLPTRPEALDAIARHGQDLRVWVARSTTAQAVDQLALSYGDPERVTSARLALDVTYDFEREPATLCMMMLIRTVLVVRLLVQLPHRTAAAAAHAYLLEDLGLLAEHTSAMVHDSRYPTLDLARRVATGFLGTSESAEAGRLVGAVLRPATEAAPLHQRGARSLLEDILCPGLDEALTMPLWPADQPSTVIRALENAQGVAVTRALARTLRESATDRGTWSEDFGAAFQSEITPDDGSVTVTPDTLLCALDETYHERLAPGREQTWWRDTAALLERLILMVAHRETALTTDFSRAMRLAALCLAAEAARHGDTELADSYYRIAAGVLLLQRRADATSIPDETILLATAWRSGDRLETQW